jgi:antirestriction protein
MLNIFVTNLGKYTEGHLVGEWVSLPCEDLNAVYKRIGVDFIRYEEVFITDYECDIEGLTISEYSNIDRLNEIAQIFEDLGEDAALALQAYLFNCYDFEEALEHIKNEDYIIYHDCESFSDLAYIRVQDGYFGDISKDLMFYIDLDKLGDTIECEGTYHFIDNVCVELTA